MPLTAGRSHLSARGLLADRPRFTAGVRAGQVPVASAGLPEQTGALAAMYFPQCIFISIPGLRAEMGF